jgi:hypothetical protein
MQKPKEVEYMAAEVCPRQNRPGGEIGVAHLDESGSCHTAQQLPFVFGGLTAVYSLCSALGAAGEFDESLTLVTVIYGRLVLQVSCCLWANSAGAREIVCFPVEERENH